MEKRSSDVSSSSSRQDAAGETADEGSEDLLLKVSVELVDRVVISAVADVTASAAVIGCDICPSNMPGYVDGGVVGVSDRSPHGADAGLHYY